MLSAEKEKTDRLGWTTWQIARNQLLAQLLAAKQVWQNGTPVNWRDDAMKRFNDYAYQWY